MDEHAQVRTLLHEAAGGTAPFAPPQTLPQDIAAGRRRAGVTPLLAAACAVVTVVAVAVGISLVHGHSTPAARTSSPATATGDSAVSVATLSTYRWRTLPAAPIATRTDAAVVWTGTRMLVWGGAHGNTLFGDGATYDPATRRWTKLPPAPLTPRTGTVSAWVGGSFVVWGGYDGLHLRTDGARYTPATNRWTALPKAPVVTTSDSAQLVVAGDHAVLVTIPRQGGRNIDAATYSPATNTWTRLPALTVPAQHDVGMTAAVTVGDVLVWAYWAHVRHTGPGSTSTTTGIDAYLLDPVSGRWRRAPFDAARDRLSGVSFWTRRSVLMLNQDIWCGGCSHPAGLHIPSTAIDWRTGQHTGIADGPLSTANPTYAWTGAAVIALNPGSSVGPAVRPGDVAAWNPTTNRWTALRPVTGLAGQPQVIWAGDRLIVWGGEPYAGHPVTGTELAPR